MSLMKLQRTMARAVMQPLTRAERMQRKAPGGGAMSAYASRFIKPNDRLTSFERLEIYNRQYWFRVLSSMMEDFSGVRAVLGEQRFEEMAKAYLTDNPSRSFTLRNLGSRLEAWLRKHPKWAGAKQKLALDIVRLEWADIEAFDGRAEPALRAADIRGGGGPNLRLKLQPYLQLLNLRYPVDDLLLEVRNADEDTDFASNAFQERRKRKRVQAVAQLKPAEIYLTVHRVDYSVYFRRIDREEFFILSALRQGKTLGKAIDGAFRKSSITPKERASRVQEWFQNWATLGWFCRVEKKGLSHRSFQARRASIIGMNKLILRVKELHDKFFGLMAYAQTPFLLLVRLYWGWQLVVSGWGKLHNLDKVTEFFTSLGLPMPGPTAVFISSLEFFGGILLALGLFSRVISLMLTVNLITAYITADREALFSIFSDPDKFMAAAPFTFLFASLLILIFGPGKIAADTPLGRWFVAPKEQSRDSAPN